jgi:hypothetical protein
MMAKLLYKDPNVRVPRIVSPIARLPAQLKPYKFKTAQIDAPPSLDTSPPPEVLTGYVNGKEASKLEERFAMALDFYDLRYIFQYEVASAYSIPGEGKLIDFIVYDGGVPMPIEVGSAFVHKSPAEQQAELQRTQILNPILQAIGIQPFNEFSHLPLDRPADLEDAKELVRSLFISA